MENLGDIFGEMSIVSETTRSASVFAMEEAVCLAANVSGKPYRKRQTRIRLCLIPIVCADLGRPAQVDKQRAGEVEGGR